MQRNQAAFGAGEAEARQDIGADHLRVENMTGARILFYAHCLLAVACVAVLLFILEGRSQSGWRFDRQLEVHFAKPLVSWAYQAAAWSCFVFPAALAYKVVGRISPWRWSPLMAADVFLGWFQFVALVGMWPIRW